MLSGPHLCQSSGTLCLLDLPPGDQMEEEHWECCLTGLPGMALRGLSWGRLRILPTESIGAYLLAEGTGPPQLAPQRDLLQQPSHLGPASFLSPLSKWPLGREESLDVFHCEELGCKTEGDCSSPTMPQAPIDGRISGE